MMFPVFIAAVDPSKAPFYVAAAVAIVALVVWLVVYIVRRIRADNAAWRALEQDLGLRKVGERAWSASVDGLSLALEYVREKSARNSASIYHLHVTIGGVPTDVHLGSEGFLASLGDRGLGWIHGPDIPTGDTTFDAAVKLKGDEGAALALLDAETRDVLRRATADGWLLADGAWRHDGSSGFNDVHVHVKRGLDLARIARAASGAVLERLAARAVTDPLPTVRRKALELLLKDHRAAPVSREAFAAARSDEDVHNRLLVARETGDLRALLELAGDEGHAVGVRAAALDAITHDVADTAADGRARMLAIAERWLAHASPELRRAALRALARVAAPSAEALLVGALADRDDDVQLEAVRALGAIGTVAAVPALAPLRDRLLGFALKGAATSAILAIQARVGPAEAGALALAEGSGALALADE